MATTYSITVDSVGVVGLLTKLGESMRPAILEQLGIVSMLVRDVMKEKAPDAFGNLRDSIGYKIVPETLTSEIKPDAPYGDAVETGTRPHWISVSPGSPLEQWALFRGINPYAVQRSIAVKGTKAHPFIKPTYDEVAPEVNAKFAEGIAKLIGGLRV
jgi:HK97 gp10 family phage protein